MDPNNKPMTAEEKRKITRAMNKVEREAWKARWKAEGDARAVRDRAVAKAEQVARDQERKEKIQRLKAAAEAKKAAQQASKKPPRDSHGMNYLEIDGVVDLTVDPVLTPRGLMKEYALAVPATEFLLFPILLLKLRLKIFHFMFPRDRRIPLWMQTIFTRAPIPVTLHINRESRRETLRYYHVLWPSKSPTFRPDLGVMDRPLIINPELDTISLPLSSRLQWKNGTSAEGPSLWVAFLDKALKGGLKSIKYMHVFHTGSPYYEMQLLPEVAKDEPRRGLQLFAGLEDLTVQHFVYADDDDNEQERRFRRIVRIVDRFYECYEEKFKEFQIPKINYRPEEINGDRSFHLYNWGLNI